MEKIKKILANTFSGFKPRKYLDMNAVDLEMAQDGVDYRLAEKLDIVDMLAIERDVYDGEVPWTFSHFEYEIVDNVNSFFLVAQAGRRVVGFAGARVVNGGREVHITNLAVATVWQGRGIASTLIQQVVRMMRLLGKETVTLEVRRDNTKAQGIYRRHGFIATKNLPKYYEDGGDAVWMEKDLKHYVTSS